METFNKYFGIIYDLRTITIFSATMSTLLFCGLLGLLPHSWDMIWAIIGVILVTMYYIWFLRYIIVGIESSGDKMWMLPILYICLTVLIAMMFATLVLGVDGITIMGVDSIKEEMFVTFYYCLMTITTVGYGDISPTTNIGYLLSMAMSLIGTANMICFIALIMEKLTSVSCRRVD